MSVELAIPTYQLKHRKKISLNIMQNGVHDEPNPIFENKHIIHARRVHKLPILTNGWKGFLLPNHPNSDLLNKILPQHEGDERIIGIEYFILVDANEEEGIDSKATIQLSTSQVRSFEQKLGKWVEFVNKNRLDSRQLVTPALIWIVCSRKQGWLYLKLEKSQKKKL